MGFYRILRDHLPIAVSGNVVKAVMERNLGAWHPGHSRKNPEVQVFLISRVSPAFSPFRSGHRPTTVGWFQKWGKRMRGWVSVGLPF
jgi:hypothetical protein